MRHLLGRLRVPGGFVALCVVLAFGVQADEIVLPYANINLYTSTLVDINPTANPIDVTRPCVVGPCIIDRIPPYSVRRLPGWPGSGTDHVVLDRASALITYVDLRTPLGTMAHLQPLVAATGPVRFYDLPTPGEFEGYVWISPAAGHDRTYVTIVDDGAPIYSVELAVGAVILPITGPTVAIYPGAAPGWPWLPGPQKFYAFAFTTHDATGAITPHVAR